MFSGSAARSLMSVEHVICCSFRPGGTGRVGRVGTRPEIRLTTDPTLQRVFAGVTHIIIYRQVYGEDRVDLATSRQPIDLLSIIVRTLSYSRELYIAVNTHARGKSGGDPRARSAFPPFRGARTGPTS